MTKKCQAELTCGNRKPVIFLYHRDEKILTKYGGMHIVNNFMLTLLPECCGHRPKIDLKLCAK